MNQIRRRKLFLVLFILLILTVATSLILYALRQNINLFYAPEQIASGKAPLRRLIRVGGMVVENSLIRSNGLSVQFKLTDFKEIITVSYQGILPDLFREGQGVVALGELEDNQHFVAKEVLAKHDANYMPHEVSDALNKKA